MKWNIFQTPNPFSAPLYSRECPVLVFSFLLFLCFMAVINVCKTKNGNGSEQQLAANGNSKSMPISISNNL